MSENAAKPLSLPIEAADLPAVDERVLEAICLEYHYSILQFAMGFIGLRWTPEQIGHVAARWTWRELAGAVAYERQKLGKEPVAATYLAGVVAQRAASPEGIKVPPQPPPPLLTGKLPLRDEVNA